MGAVMSISLLHTMAFHSKKFPTPTDFLNDIKAPMDIRDMRCMNEVDLYKGIWVFPKIMVPPNHPF